MNATQASARLHRIAEIAREIYHTDRNDHCEDDCITPKIVKAVDDARRAEYYERKEQTS